MNFKEAGGGWGVLKKKPYFQVISTHLLVEADLFSEEILHHLIKVQDPFMLKVVDLSYKRDKTICNLTVMHTSCHAASDCCIKTTI